MNIVHFTTGRINPAAAKVGLVNVIYHVAQQQARAGHNVRVVVLPDKREYENTAATEFTIQEYASPRFAGFGVDPVLLDDLGRRHIAIDIAHLHGVWSPTVAMLGRALVRCGIPYVLSSHGSFSPFLMTRQALRKQAFRRIFALTLLNHANRVHLHSDEEVEEARSFGVSAPTMVAEQGIELAEIPVTFDQGWLASRFPQHADAFKVVFLGRLDPFHKGIDLLLEGFSLALRRCEKMVLFLIGPEKRRYRSEVPELVLSHALQSHVHLLGPIYDPQEKYAALASADCFALTSRFEGFPLTVFEAMACRTPVVVTPATHAASLVRDSRAGLVAQPHASAIAEALLAMQADGSRREMGVRAREAVQQFTWTRTAERLCAAYREVLHG